MNNNDGFYYNFDNEELIIPMEFWKPITSKSVPSVRPFYWVSDLGRVWNINTNRFVPQFDDAKRGYLLITLATETGNVTKSVHRIVMIEFMGYDPDITKDEVDHKSGIKYNNSIYNLRWVSGSENITAAYDLGLMPSGEDSPNSIFTNDEIREICLMMQNGVPRNKIYDFIASKGSTSPSSVFYAIYNRTSWKRVSEGYVFQDYNERGRVFTDEQVHEICKCLESGMTHDAILIHLGIDLQTISRNDKNNFYTAISHIKKGENHLNISSLYNIDRNSNKNVFSDEEVVYICERFEQGISNKQILFELGYNINVSEDRSRYFKYMNAIVKIRNRVNYTYISKDYAF